MTYDNSLRAVALVATGLVEEMRRIHEVGPVATIALGRAAIGALLLAGRAKHGHRVGVSFQGSGPMARLFAEATYDGKVRAFVSLREELPLQMNERGSVSLASSIGHGVLTVFEGLPGRGEPHRATVELRTGEVGDDIAYYLHQSLQTRNVVHLGVYLGSGGEVLGAGGGLIEVLPGVQEETLLHLEAIVGRSPALSERIRAGGTARDLAEIYLGDLGFRELSPSGPIEYNCRCNEERFHRSLLLLGRMELDAIIKSSQAVEANCEFCGRKYRAEIPTIVELRNQLPKNQSH